MVCSSQRCSTASRAKSPFFRQASAPIRYRSARSLPVTLVVITLRTPLCHRHKLAQIPPFVPCSLGSLFFALGFLQVAHPSRIPTPFVFWFVVPSLECPLDIHSFGDRSLTPKKKKNALGSIFSIKKVLAAVTARTFLMSEARALVLVAERLIGISFRFCSR